MHHYYVVYPRDFTNEYIVYVVAAGSDTERHLCKVFPDAQRISRRQAVYLGWTRPREAKRNGEQWFGGFAQTGSVFTTTTKKAIIDAIHGTRLALEGHGR